MSETDSSTSEKETRSEDNVAPPFSKGLMGRVIRRPKHSIKRGSTMRTDSLPNGFQKREFVFINGWTPELEAGCRRIAQESAVYKWLHNKNSILLSGTLDKTTLSAAIISAINGATGLSGFLTENYTDALPWLSPTVTLLGFLLSLTATIILIVQRTYNFTEKIENHRKAERGYNWLFFKVQSELQKPIKKRQDGNVFFGWVTHELSSISSSEDIDDGIIGDFYKTFEDGKIPGLDTLDQVDVNEQISTPKSSVPPSVEHSFDETLQKNSENAGNTRNVRIQSSPRPTPTPTSSPGPTSSPPPSLAASTGDILHPVTQVPQGPQEPHEPNISDSDIENISKEKSERNKKKPLIRSTTKRNNEEKKNIRQFRTERDIGLMSIISQAHAPKRSRRIRHNPAMMEYEMRRHEDDGDYQSSGF